MSEGKDPAIKLFGKTIQLPDTPPPPSECEDPTPCSPNHPLSEEYRSLSTRGGGGGAEEDPGKDPLEVTADDSKAEDVARSMKSQELTDPNLVENLEAASVDDLSAKASKNEEEQNETGNGQDKTPKKPDKIIPCPRCNSMDTKFCYYNNYNMNQPRHFCKNCQRYWTAGGTRRNVPVGAGRRKNKNTSSQYRHINGPEPLQTAHPDLPNGVHYPALKPNGTVLTFGTDAPLCESMESVLNIAEKAARNGFHRPEELRIPNPYGTGGNGDDQSNVFAVAVSSSGDEASKDGLPEKLIPNYHGIPPQISCFPGAPWPYPWNSVQWSHPVPPAAFCPGSFPMPFYPAAPYWGCAVPGTWNVHWVNPPNASQSHSPPTSGPNSQTLGKHSRDDSMLKSTDSDKEESQKESNTEKCLWFPKTLRLDDPGEAARSSIWATLGIKHDKVDSVVGGGLFKAFRSKGDTKPNVSETFSVLQANPAALSRSLSFRESS